MTQDRQGIGPADPPAPWKALQQCRLFSGLGEGALSELASTSRGVTLGRRDPLFRMGGPADRLFVLRHGIVEVNRPAGPAEEAFLGWFGAREAVGLPAALEGSPYPADAVAVTAVEAISVSASALRRSMQADASVAAAVSRELVAHGTLLRHQLFVMSAPTVESRLARVLLNLLERFGDEDGEGRTFLPLQLTRVRLAQACGARVETVSRTMAAWERESFVVQGPSALSVFDPDRLARLAGRER